MKAIHFVLLLVCAAMISCGQKTSSVNTNDEAKLKDIMLPNKPEETADVDKAFRITATDTTALSNETVYQQAPPAIEWDKKIIKTANIEAECKDYTSYNRKLHAMVKQYGGWIAAESETRDNGRINNSISIKVPVQQFEDLVNNIANADGKVLRKAITTEDVTDNIVDAEGRVRVKKAMRDKYLIMLTHAAKMEDVLNVQSKIDEIHEEIEMSATRLNALQHQSAYSTVNINYFQPMEGAVVSDETPGLGSRFLSAAFGGAAWLGDLLIGIISIWPLALVAIIIFYFIKRKFAHSVVVKSNDTQA
ncbi:hypothetical protein BH10BAC3_BH10BAC3_02100 [soil metagenome]